MHPFSQVLPVDPVALTPCPPVQHRPQTPMAVPVLRNTRLTPPDYPEDIRLIVIDLKGTDFVFAEGQSVGIVPPGHDAGGRPHRMRLFSVACPATGEPGTSRTLSLCVKRLVFKTLAEEIQTGICSNYLCDTQPGDTVHMSGPNGKHFTPPACSAPDLLLFATGTGISPFRAFLLRLLNQEKPYHGTIHLFYGSRTRHDHVFAGAGTDELLRMAALPRFFLHSALSREEHDGRIHVDDLLHARARDIEDVLDRRDYSVYLCGIRGMERGIQEFFRHYIERRTGRPVHDAQWAAIKEHLKRLGRWAQEVY